MCERFSVCETPVGSSSSSTWSSSASFNKRCCWPGATEPEVEGREYGERPMKRKKDCAWVARDAANRCSLVQNICREACGVCT